MADEKYYGVVAWFEPKKKKCYGFIEWEKDGVKQEDMFVHYSDIVCKGFKTLYKGQKVQFSIGANHHGQPKAINVEVLKN